MIRIVTPFLLSLIAMSMSEAAEKTGQPIIIGHRGASGYRPEHTLASYELAIDQGADYIEPDLVSTRDGVLVARHENAVAIVHPVTGALIEATTNVMDKPEFAGRKTTRLVDGVSLTGWFSEDFTLAELKTLRAKERLPQVRPRNTAYDNLYEVPTLQEVIDLAKRKSVETGRVIGIYPETKHPTYFASIGLSPEEPLVRTLDANGYTNGKDPVFIQSFEVGNLKKLRRMTRVRIVQLLSSSGAPWDFVEAGDPRTYADIASPSGLKEISTYADGIGANKNLVIPRDSAGRLTSPTSLVGDAHAQRLVVHLWTFRSENTFLPTEYRNGTAPADYGDFAGEYEKFFAARIDGLFSDQPDHAIASRNNRRQ